MKKILLYYPKLQSDEDSKPLYTGLPLSIMSLAAQFDKSRFEVKMIDGRMEDYQLSLPEQYLDNELIFVGISALTCYQIKSGLEFAAYIKDVLPHIPVVWGGWHSSLMPKQTIENDLVDIIITGQGEKVIVELTERLLRGEDLFGLDNVLFKRGDEIIENKRYYSDVITSVERTAAVYEDIDINKYVQPLWGNQRVIGYESSRGCPWKCKFCSIGSVYGGKWGALSADVVADDIELLYKKYGIDAVHFYDNNFFVNKNRVLTFSDKLLEKNISVKWDGTANVEQIAELDDSFFSRLKQSGFYRVIVGAESGDEDVLEKIGKRHTNAQLIEMVKKCKQHNIMVSLSFMVGFPWNPDKDLDETIKIIEKIKHISSANEILLFIFSPYIGTELYEIALDYGMKFPDNLADWSTHTYERSNVPWISKKTLRKINRYISFFGTKDLSEDALNFYRGGIAE